MKDISGIIASQVMHSPVICASPDELLKELEERLEDRHISGMPVVENGEMIGIITQNDLTQLPSMMDSMANYVYGELLSSGPVLESADENQDGMPDNLSFRGQISKMKVREAMRRKVISCDPATTIEDVMRLMADHGVHRIVVAENARPVGIISTLDVLRLLVND